MAEVVYNSTRSHRCKADSREATAQEGQAAVPAVCGLSEGVRALAGDEIQEVQIPAEEAQETIIQKQRHLANMVWTLARSRWSAGEIASVEAEIMLTERKIIVLQSAGGG